MVAPLLPREIVIEFFPILLMIVLSIASVMEFRQGHIGRVAILANVVVAWQVFYGIFDPLPNWAAIYLNVGTIAGGFAGIAYLLQESLNTMFYRLVGIGYGSLTILLVVVLGLM